MPIISFTGYILTILFGKTENWRQLYKQTTCVSNECVSKITVEKKSSLVHDIKTFHYKYVEVRTAASDHGIAV